MNLVHYQFNYTYHNLHTNTFNVDPRLKKTNQLKCVITGNDQLVGKWVSMSKWKSCVAENQHVCAKINSIVCICFDSLNRPIVWHYRSTISALLLLYVLYSIWCLFKCWAKRTCLHFKNAKLMRIRCNYSWSMNVGKSVPNHCMRVNDSTVLAIYNSRYDIFIFRLNFMFRVYLYAFVDVDVGNFCSFFSLESSLKRTHTKKLNEDIKHPN